MNPKREAQICATWMDTVMAEGLTRLFDSAEDAADDLVASMRAHGWNGDIESTVHRLIAGETIEHTRHTYRITVEP